MRSRSALLAAVVTGLLAAPATAFASTIAPKAGTWHGTTSQGSPLSFTVARKHVAHSADQSYFKRVTVKATLACEDGATITETYRINPGYSLRFAISGAGSVSKPRFLIQGFWTIGGQQVWISFTGAFSSRTRAKGGLNVALRDTPHGDCDTHDYTYTAKS